MSPSTARLAKRAAPFLLVAAGVIFVVIVASTASYARWRTGRATRLTRNGPSPQKYDPEIPPSGVEEIFYTSGNLRLKAWFARPDSKTAVPAAVDFHGGFAFGREDWDDARPFLDAGFAVLCPTLRGENGNPGSFELFYGEVDDGRAAIRWLAAQPGIDKDRIFAFGHSVGGGISALLALYDEPKLLLTGSAGGLYPREVFEAWRDIAPFDVNDSTECDLRLLSRNLGDMRCRHIAYVGQSDELGQFLPAIRERARKRSAPLEIETVAGDHMQSLEPAMQLFIARCKRAQPTP